MPTPWDDRSFVNFFYRNYSPGLTCSACVIRDGDIRGKTVESTLRDDEG